MKKALVLLSSGMLLLPAVFFTGCGGNNDNEANKDTIAIEAPVAEKKDPMAMEGLELIGKSDCLTCHKLNEAATGPAYSAVAARYAGNQAGQDSLVHKILVGGAGNWGQIPMSAHPNLTEEDAKKMVAYVMSIKPE